MFLKLIKVLFVIAVGWVIFFGMALLPRKMMEHPLLVGLGIGVIINVAYVALFNNGFGWFGNGYDSDDHERHTTYSNETSSPEYRINPATGLPMAGPSSIDVGGNAYGTSSDWNSDTSWNSFDSGSSFDSHNH